MTTKVSVIMPCYNEPEDIFRRSLESVINQTLSEIEIIIILDNPDNTQLAEIIREYQRNCDKILLLTPEKNLGRGQARNLGISFAEGEYIAIHDADDIDVPERLQDQYIFMEENPELSIVFSGIRYVDVNQKQIAGKADLNGVKDSVVNYPLIDNGKNHPTMFAKTKALKENPYLGWNISEDFELWIRLIRKGFKMSHTGEIHTKYLAPEDMEMREYLQKMIKWNLGGIRAMLKHISYLYGDKKLYSKIVKKLLNLLKLSIKLCRIHQ